MGFYKEEKSIVRRLWRFVKTVFFLITMLVSLLFFSAPVLLVIADALIPSALLSASLSYTSSPLSIKNLSSHFSDYDFRYSLTDVPLISVVRSAIIICVYSLCDGPRLSGGPYLGITTICCVLSVVFVGVKGLYVFRVLEVDRGEYVRAMEMGLIISSLVLAIGHIFVAYKICCKQRRKLLVYKIDIEAVSACKKGFPRYHQKILREERER